MVAADREGDPAAQPAWPAPPPPDAPAPPGAPWPAPPASPPNNQAVAALCLGVVGLFLVLTTAGLLFFVNLPVSVLACVFGAQGKRRVDRGETDRHRDLAHAGVVTGVIGIVLGIGALIVWSLLLVLAFSVTP